MRGYPSGQSARTKGARIPNRKVWPSLGMAKFRRAFQRLEKIGLALKCLVL